MFILLSPRFASPFILYFVFNAIPFIFFILFYFINFVSLSSWSSFVVVSFLFVFFFVGFVWFSVYITLAANHSPQITTDHHNNRGVYDLGFHRCNSSSQRRSVFFFIVTIGAESNKAQNVIRMNMYHFDAVLYEFSRSVSRGWASFRLHLRSLHTTISMGSTRWKQSRKVPDL